MKEIKSKAITKQPALKFFVLVYTLSVPLWIVSFFLNNRNLPLNIPITDILAAFTPMIAACILTFMEKGKPGVLKLLNRIWNYKEFKNSWGVIIGILFMGIFGLIYFLLWLLNYPLPSTWQISFYTIPFLLVFFYLGAAGEEVGYMGYAFEKLHPVYNALAASLLVGIPWIIWHFPSMYQQGRDLNFFLWGTLGTISFRIIFVWLYLYTNKNLFSCILLHCLYNTGRVFFPSNRHLNPLVQYPAIHYGTITAISILILLLYRRSFSKTKTYK